MQSTISMSLTDLHNLDNVNWRHTAAYFSTRGRKTERAEDRVAQQGFVTWKLKEALFVTTQKFPTEIVKKIGGGINV